MHSARRCSTRRYSEEQLGYLLCSADVLCCPLPPKTQWLVVASRCQARETRLNYYPSFLLLACLLDLFGLQGDYYETGTWLSEEERQGLDEKEAERRERARQRPRSRMVQVVSFDVAGRKTVQYLEEDAAREQEEREQEDDKPQDTTGAVCLCVSGCVCVCSCFSVCVCVCVAVGGCVLGNCSTRLHSCLLFAVLRGLVGAVPWRELGTAGGRRGKWRRQQGGSSIPPAAGQVGGWWVGSCVCYDVCCDMLWYDAVECNISPCFVLFIMHHRLVVGAPSGSGSGSSFSSSSNNSKGQGGGGDGQSDSKGEAAAGVALGDTVPMTVPVTLGSGAEKEKAREKDWGRRAKKSAAPRSQQQQQAAPPGAKKNRGGQVGATKSSSSSSSSGS